VNLSPDELAALTGKSKPSAQARELEHLGIPFKSRRDGSLVVLRVHVESGETQPIPNTTRTRPRVRFDA
jgi:hypothetical protein